MNFTTTTLTSNINSSEDDIIFYFVIVINTISMIGSLFVILLYATTPQIRSFAFLLVLYLCISNLIYELGNMIGMMRRIFLLDIDYLCNIQGFLTNFGELASICWTSMIAYSLYSTIVEGIKNIETRLKLYTTISFGIPVVLSSILCVTHDYGPAGDWCWISDMTSSSTNSNINTNNNNDGTSILLIMFGILEFYGPLWIAIIFNTYCIIMVIKTMQSIRQNIDDDISYVNKFKYYPLVLIICWTPGTINRIQNFISSNPIFVLNFLQFTFCSFQGFCDALVYGMTPTVRSILKESGFLCLKRTNNPNNELNDSLNKNQVIIRGSIHGVELSNSSSKL